MVTVFHKQHLEIIFKGRNGIFEVGGAMLLWVVLLL